MTKEARSRKRTVIGRGSGPGAPDTRPSSFGLRHFSRLVCALLLTSRLPAQVGLPPGADLFGDEIVQKLDHVNGVMRMNGGDEEHGKPVAKVTGLDHALAFHDGRQLRGTLVELTREEIVWRRPDVNEPLRFARSEVRRIVLAEAAEDSDSGSRLGNRADIEIFAQLMMNQFAHGIGEMIAEAVGQVVTGDLGRAVRIPNILQVTALKMSGTMKEMDIGVRGEITEVAGSAKEVATGTLKLPGGDWLFGEVTSADGETFAMKLADGTPLAIPRGPVEWLHLDERPAPAFGYAGGALDLESWTVRTPGSRMEVEAGTLTVRDGWLLGRAITPPKRFEIAFELPEDSEDGLRLWIQPFGPQPNSYGMGTVELGFGKKEISRCIYVRKFDRKKTALPQEAAEQKGPVGYRVLYDGIGRRLVVVRNGVQLGDWKFIEEVGKDGKAQPISDEERDITINGVCFDRPNRDAKRPLKFNRLAVQPWDGTLPAAGEAAPAGDRLTLGNEPPATGKLQSLSANEIVFSGVKRKREAGTFLRLHDAAPSLAGADAMLVFGQQGEISVAGLEIRDGRARGRAGFAEALDLPTAALQTVVFPSRPEDGEKTGDALVFRNGDEMRGTLLSATAADGLRWKMAGGREIAMAATHLAGVRFAAAGAAPKSAALATVEMRNGDRLRGEFAGLDGQHVELQHAQLGTVRIAREQVWSLYPNPRFQVWDGSRDAAAWIAKTRTEGAPVEPEQEKAQWTVLDGSYIQRRARGGSSEAAALRVPMAEMPERFEFRVEATDVGGNPPSFGITLGTKDGKTSLQASFNYFNLSLYMNSPKARQRPNYKNVALSDKVPDASSRMALRVFVDRTAGTADFFLNGAFVARVGQQQGERLPGLGEVMSVTASQQEDSTSILSSLWIGPWNGELPRLGEGVPAATALTNGDAAPATPEGWRDGKFLVETPAGMLELPLEKVQAVEFGGVMAPEKAAGRIRLADGGVVSVDAFRWDGRELTAHSAALGELRLPATAVNELIFNPAPVRPPRNPSAKKLAQKAADAATNDESEPENP